MNKQDIEIALRVFGCGFEATLEQIKAEYKNLACAFHPDRYEAGSNKQNWAAEKLIELNSAYETLQKYFKEYPDGPPSSWNDVEPQARGHQNSTAAPPDTDQDGYCDWQQWGQAQSSSSGDNFAQWQGEQQARQEEFKQHFGQMNRKKFAFYGKVAAAAFVCVLWIGRISNAEATKMMVANEHQALVEQQQYEQARQGSNIDGFVWDQQLLEERHRNQFEEFAQNNRERSAKMWTSGIFTSLLTIAVIWFLIQSSRKKNNLEEK